MQKFIIAPMDAHNHFREDEMLKTVFPFTVRLCEAAVAMGNLKDPVDNFERVTKYWKEIMKETKTPTQEFRYFEPIMSLMLTPRTTVETIRQCFSTVKLLKLIPANASTNSQAGVALEDLAKYYPVLTEARKHGIIFSIHAERTHDNLGNEIPEAQREEAARPFIRKLIRDIPGLKIIIEHVSTEKMCDLIKTSPSNVAGTITAHHVTCNNELLYFANGKINPLYYCKPVLKSEADRLAVEQAMLSGSPRFFYGSDSAAHPSSKKFDVYPPAAGIFSAPVAIPLIAEVFDQAGKIDKLENFLSIFGRNFYGLPIPPQKITIRRGKTPWTVPEFVGPEKIPVFMAGKRLHYYAEPVPPFNC